MYDLGKFWKAIKQWETEDCVDSARFLFKMSVFWKKVVTSAIQNKLKMLFKDLSFKYVVFGLTSSVLALFRASSKYNIRLRYLTGRCQIAALCCLYRLLWTVLAVKLFLGFFGLQYLIIAFFKFCILAIYNLFQLGKL